VHRPTATIPAAGHVGPRAEEDATIKLWVDEEAYTVGPAGSNAAVNPRTSKCRGGLQQTHAAVNHYHSQSIGPMSGPAPCGLAGNERVSAVEQEPLAGTSTLRVEAELRVVLRSIKLERADAPNILHCAGNCSGSCRLIAISAVSVRMVYQCAATRQ